MVEEPICKVTIVAMHGAVARRQMDELSLKVITYPNGSTLWGYAVKTSGEGIVHVRVSEIGKIPQWIRCWEKDGSNPLVSIDYIPNEATAVTDLTKSIRELTKAILDTK